MFSRSSVDSDGGVTVTKDQEAMALRGQMLLPGKFCRILTWNE